VTIVRFALRFGSVAGYDKGLRRLSISRQTISVFEHIHVTPTLSLHVAAEIDTDFRPCCTTYTLSCLLSSHKPRTNEVRYTATPTAIGHTIWRQGGERKKLQGRN
jgi:hypothetical protein